MAKRWALLALAVVLVCAGLPACGRLAAASTPVPYETFAGDTDYAAIRQEDVGVYDGDIVPNDTVAKGIADLVVFQSMGCTNEDLPQWRVEYDTTQNAWLIFYYQDEETAGGGLLIVLSKKTGEVLLVQSQE